MINVLVLEILPYDILLNNEARNVLYSTLTTEYQQSLDPVYQHGAGTERLPH
jgi:hypothetical protein